MNVHEYQAKEILRAYGLPVLNGRVVRSSAEALEAANQIGGSAWALKAQVHTRGRALAGGVKKATGPEEIVALTEDLLTNRIITKRTGAEGVLAKEVLVEASCEIGAEFFLRVAINRAKNRIEVLASKEANHSFEVLVLEHPDKVISSFWDQVLVSSDYMARKLAYGIGLKNGSVKKFSELIKNLLKLFCEKDCTVIEINPLALTKGGELAIIDANIDFDDTALFRHPEVARLRDPDEFSHEEYEALLEGISHIKLGGTIATLTNGAGLSMAMLDLIREKGGLPYNFMDIGGLATEQSLTKILTMLLLNPKVEKLAINIFGGIVKCDLVANALLAALVNQPENGSEIISKPIYVRFEGTNVAVGKKILKDSIKDSKRTIVFCDSLTDLANKVVGKA